MPTLGLCINDGNATHSKDADGNVDPSMSTDAAKSIVDPSSNAAQSAGGSTSKYRSLLSQYYQALQESAAMAHADNTTPQADNTMGRGAYSSMVEGVNLQAQFAVPPETFNPLSLMPNPTFAPPLNGGGNDDDKWYACAQASSFCTSIAPLMCARRKRSFYPRRYYF